MPKISTGTWIVHKSYRTCINWASGYGIALYKTSEISTGTTYKSLSSYTVISYVYMFFIQIKLIY